MLSSEISTISSIPSFYNDESTDDSLHGVDLVAVAPEVGDSTFDEGLGSGDLEVFTPSCVGTRGTYMP